MSLGEITPTGLPNPSFKSLPVMKANVPGQDGYIPGEGQIDLYYKKAEPRSGVRRDSFPKTTIQLSQPQ